MMRRISELADAAVAHPLMLPAYIVTCAIAHALYDVDHVTLALSHFANIVLILLAGAQRRQGIMQAKEIHAMAEADDRVDVRAIEAECP